jgi:hypothetical protein
MCGQIPTKWGDVLIVVTFESPMYTVGAVSTDGQQDPEMNYRIVHGQAAGFRAARSLMVPGHRIYLKNSDTGMWLEVAVDASVDSLPDDTAVPVRRLP